MLNTPNAPGPDTAPVTVVTLVATPDPVPKDGQILVRTWTTDGPSASLEVSGPRSLKPADILIVTGNARCRIDEVRKSGDSPAVTTPIAFIESIRIEPAAPPWLPNGRPDPEERRFLAFQSPPVLEVRHYDHDLGRVHQVFVDGAMAQVLG